MMSAAGTFSGAVGRAIPMLSNITGPTEWFMRTAANAVSALGYSKPLEVNRPQNTIRSVTTNQHNFDGFEPSLNLGFAADTKIGSMPLAGLDVDEMSFEFLKSVSTRFDLFNFAKTSGRDTVLWSKEQKISDFYDQESAQSLRTATMPQYLANFGKYWRGDLVINFQAVRTQFHSGKLLIGFIPHNDDNDVTPSVADVLDYHSVMWDLSVTDSVEFTLPFTSARAWSNFDFDNGQVFVSVVAPLSCPANVAQSIPITVSVKCGDNFCVAAQQSVHVLGTYGGPDVATQNKLAINTVFAAQTGAPYATLSSEEAELYCVGNALRSSKQLLSKSIPVTGTPFALLPPYAHITEHAVDWPAQCKAHHAEQTDNFHALIMGAYALRRGSWNCTAISDSFNVMIEANTDASTSVRGRDILSVSVPYYSDTTRRTDTPAQKVTYTAEGHLFFEAHAGDDYQLGCFLHTPWLLIP